MQETDEYKTIATPSTGLYKEKGSKFLSFAEPVGSEEQIKTILEKYRKQYHDARHHCYAWATGYSRENHRMNDDGEPSGTAGKPIFGQILSFDLTNILIVVVRYFGGTKLGVGGLITAYKTAAREALENASIITRTVNEEYEIVFGYPETSDVMRIIKENNYQVAENYFTEKCRLVLSLRRKNAKLVAEKFNLVDGLSIKHLRTV